MLQAVHIPVTFFLPSPKLNSCPVCMEGIMASSAESNYIPDPLPAQSLVREMMRLVWLAMQISMTDHAPTIIKLKPLLPYRLPAGMVADVFFVVNA